MKIKMIRVLNGGEGDIQFEVGNGGVTRIIRNEKNTGDFIVFLKKDMPCTEIDVKANNVLIYWG